MKIKDLIEQIREHLNYDFWIYKKNIDKHEIYELIVQNADKICLKRIYLDKTERSLTNAEKKMMNALTRIFIELEENFILRHDRMGLIRALPDPIDSAKKIQELTKVKKQYYEEDRSITYNITIHDFE